MRLMRRDWHIRHILSYPVKAAATLADSLVRAQQGALLVLPT